MDLPLGGSLIAPASTPTSRRNADVFTMADDGRPFRLGCASEPAPRPDRRPPRPARASFDEATNPSCYRAKKKRRYERFDR